MSTMVDNRWDPILQNQQGPITSGYVSNSDIRQRERKDQIKWERQREYEDLMNKPGEPEQGQQQQRIPPVYYKTGAAGNSLPLGSYEESRRTLDDQRQQEYNQFVAQKKDSENKRREELYRNSQQNYRPPPEPEMYDHGQIAKDLREERQKEYNDYLKQKISEEHSRIKHRHRYTPAGGLPIGQYDLQRKRLRDELSRDYKQSLLKQQKEQLYNRATQQGEVSVINRSSPTQAPPNQISPRGRPPPHPDSGRRRGPPPPQNDRMPMESHRPQEGELRTGFFDDRRQSPLNRDERQQDYQQFLANKQREDDMRHQRLEDQRHAPHLDLSKGDYYDAETYERKRQSLNSERKNDYQNFLSKQNSGVSSQRNGPIVNVGLPLYQEKYDDHYNQLKQKRNNEYNELLEQMSNRQNMKADKLFTNRPSYRQYTPESLQGLPIGQTRYDHQRRQQEVQRNREYNEHLAKKTPEQGRREWIDTSGPKGIIAGVDSYNYDKRKTFAEERKKEYKDIMEKKHGGHAPRRMPDQAPANSIGFMANLGFHDREREKLNKERQGEYRKFLDEKAFGKEGMPRGRPNWVDGKDSWFQQDPPPFHKSPVRDQEPPRDRPASYGRRQTPSYEEILDSKRREEASYRRFEDPEYSRAGGLGGPNDRYD